MIPLVSAVLLWEALLVEQWVLGASVRAEGRLLVTALAFGQPRVLYACFSTATSNSPNPAALMY